MSTRPAAMRSARPTAGQRQGDQHGDVAEHRPLELAEVDARTRATPWYSGLSCTTHAQSP